MLRTTKKTALSPKMILTLREACKKQSNHLPIGQVDLDGSFTVLVKRGLIDVIKIPFKGENQVTWHVTKQGMMILRKLGYKEPC